MHMSNYCLQISLDVFKSILNRLKKVSAFSFQPTATTAIRDEFFPGNLSKKLKHIVTICITQVSSS